MKIEIIKSKQKQYAYKGRLGKRFNIVLRSMQFSFLAELSAKGQKLWKRTFYIQKEKASIGKI
jgi:hypothetical protein